MGAWRSTLLRCLASTEAVIDFGEDEEISANVSLNVLRMAQDLRQHLQEHVASSRCVDIITSPWSESHNVSRGVEICLGVLCMVKGLRRHLQEHVDSSRCVNRGTSGMHCD